MPVDIGVVFPPWIPPERIASAARAAEAAAIEELWVWEDCFFESGLVTATAALAATERLPVRVGLLPAPLRNVALVAMEIATLDRIFPGRFQPVVGHGVQSWMGQAGARVASPLTLLREYVTALDRLLAGERVTVSGSYVTLDDVQIAYPPLEPLHVWASGVGERTLELVGEIASGVLLDSGTSPARLREILAIVDGTARSTGRATGRPLPVYVHVFRGPDARETYEHRYGRPWNADDDALGLVGDADEIAAGVRRFADAGATTVVLRPDEDEHDIEDFIGFARDTARLVRAQR
jgi:alkanesulfonate monooxygenase SsuD/methylene tetrahydromethanopterin reductase-like flavin-dependent oxidoreductase (luciferase family)